MTFCAHVVDVEDLVLGNLSPAEAARTRAHVLACAACADQLASFEAERSLFVRRAACIAPPPDVATLLTARAAGDRRARLERFARAAQSPLAMCACLALMFAVAKLGKPHAGSVFTSSASAPDTDLAATSPEHDGEGQLASYAEGAPTSCGGTIARADGAWCEAPAPATRAEVLACGAANEGTAICASE